MTPPSGINWKSQTITPVSVVLLPGTGKQLQSSGPELSIQSEKGLAVPVTVELPADKQDTKPVATDATEEFELLQEKLEAETG